MANYVKHVTNVPQTQPLPGKQMVKNDAGGYGFEVADADLVARFLILGTAGGTFYGSERKLTVQAAEAVLREIKRDPDSVIDQIVDVAVNNRAHRQQPLLFAYALLIANSGPAIRRKALLHLAEVCRTATHLFTLISYIDQFHAFGRQVKRAFQTWIDEQQPNDLAYQMVKYAGGREGWSWVDLLRYIHLDPRLSKHAPLLHWMVKGGEAPDFRIVTGSLKAKTAKTALELAQVVSQYRLTHEMIPSEYRKSPEVWEALLPDMPYNALVRNLSTLGRVGLLIPGNARIVNLVCAKLRDEKAIQGSRIHPMAILLASAMYGVGHNTRPPIGVFNTDRWLVVGDVQDALTDAFYAAFSNLPSTGKRLLVAVDASGSMTSAKLGDVPIPASIASAALALAYAHSEENAGFVAFASRLVPVTLSHGMRLDAAMHATGQGWGEGTDVAIPVRYALTHKIPIDAFVILTDGQTWEGKRHVTQVLADYRRTMNIPAKLIVVNMAYNATSVADPADPLSLNVIGFDGSTPGAITSFLEM